MLAESNKNEANSCLLTSDDHAKLGKCDSERTLTLSDRAPNTNVEEKGLPEGSEPLEPTEMKAGHNSVGPIILNQM